MNTKKLNINENLGKAVPRNERILKSFSWLEFQNDSKKNEKNFFIVIKKEWIMRSVVEEQRFFKMKYWSLRIDKQNFLTTIDVAHSNSIKT
jgi:hypothetical protein